MDLNNYINPQLLIGIPFLIIIAKIYKDTSKSGKLIPVLLGMIGIMFAIFYQWMVIEGTLTRTCVVTGIVQGILIAGAAVYGHQLVKQAKNFKLNKEENEP